MRRENFGHTVINYLNDRCAARIGLEHDVGWFDVAMNDATRFRRSQCSRGLFCYFQGEGERHWSFTPDARFERLSLDQFHDIETLASLFSIVTDLRDIRMVNLRSGARFAEETRAHAGIFRRRPVDHFERDLGVQYRIASAVSYCHRSHSEFDRKTVRANFYFEVIVLQQSRRQSPARFRFARFLTAAQKTKTSETTKASTILRKWSTADRARAYG